jgi:hypothetical protein
MKNLLALLLLLTFTASSPILAKDKDSSQKKAVKEQFDNDDHPGKGKGRPDNPGEHGRENAAEKQSQSHGKGSKKEGSLEDEIREEFEGDEKDKNNKKGKDKKK